MGYIALSGEAEGVDGKYVRLRLQASADLSTAMPYLASEFCHPVSAQPHL